jgi:hypothetical protein
MQARLVEVVHRPCDTPLEDYLDSDGICGEGGKYVSPLLFVLYNMGWLASPKRPVSCFFGPFSINPQPKCGLHSGQIVTKVKSPAYDSANR